jgi:hypothetical protein
LILHTKAKRTHQHFAKKNKYVKIFLEEKNSLCKENKEHIFDFWKPQK